MRHIAIIKDIFTITLVDITIITVTPHIITKDRLFIETTVEFLLIKDIEVEV